MGTDRLSCISCIIVLELTRYIIIDVVGKDIIAVLVVVCGLIPILVSSKNSPEVFDHHCLITALFC